MAKLVDAQYVKQHMNEGRTKLINVLGKSSYEQQHIPGSLNAPVEEPGFEEAIEGLVPNKSDPIIVHCSDNECQASTKAARRLEQMGYTQVYEFKSGIQGWQESGGRFEGTASRERPQRPERPETGRRTKRPADRTRIRAGEEKPHVT